MPESFKSYFSPEMIEEIIDKCRRLVESKPNDPVCYRNLGHAYFKKEAYREAKAMYEKASSPSLREGVFKASIVKAWEKDPSLSANGTVFRHNVGMAYATNDQFAELVAHLLVEAQTKNTAKDEKGTAKIMPAPVKVSA